MCYNTPLETAKTSSSDETSNFLQQTIKRLDQAQSMDKQGRQQLLTMVKRCGRMSHKNVLGISVISINSKIIKTEIYSHKYNIS